MTRSGIDTSALDPDVRPQDDLYAHVNGRWIASHEIPADRAMDGSFRALHDQAEEQVRDIITEAAGLDEPTGVQAQIGALYASFMDTAAVEAAGTAPLRPELDAIAAATTPAALTEVLGGLQRTGAVSATGFWVDNDAKDPERYVVYLIQSGLGLPDESYYRDDQYAEVLAAYRPHVARMLLLGGWSADAAAADEAAGRVLALETKIAAGHWDVVADRDADRTYNPTTLTALASDAPGFDWVGWVRALRAPEGSLDRLVVREPSFATELARLWSGEPVEDWQAWLAYHTVTARAPFLSDALVEANFDFHGRTLTGAQELRARWKRGVSLVQGVLGEAVGEVYVARHFPPAHKQRMEQLVGHLVEAYRESITALDWMGEDTKAKARAKLDAFTPKIGYPVKWRDYSALEVRADDLLGNVRRASAVEQDRELHKIGRPIDRDEWFMTPQTVNAYYNPGMNEIVFPAAILQPPFFDPNADDAVNYGGIGAVIGHEMTHGFDDQGRKFDAAGNLRNWWTAEDLKNFRDRAKAIVEQFDGYTIIDDLKVNGDLTTGENIADLGGVKIALAALEKARDGKPEAPKIDGFDWKQRFFLSFAQIWRTNVRDETKRLRGRIDPHSPPMYRVNGPLSNLPEFAEAFHCPEGCPMVRKPSARVNIW